MANKINLSLRDSTLYSRSLRQTWFTRLGRPSIIVTLSFVLMGIYSNRNLSAQTVLKQGQSASAQVPPREGVVSQRKVEKPRKDEPIEWVTTTYDTFSLTPWCTLTFIGKDGKEAVMDFCGETVTYSGELEADEAAKVFFEYLRGYIAACQSHTKEKREE